MTQLRGRNPRILILSCSGGAGHLRAAEGLHRTARHLRLPIHVEHYDILDFTSPIFKRLYSETYLNLVNSAPDLWGYMYEQTEKRPYRKQWFVKIFDHFNYRRYQRFLSHIRPDAIICTHFLPFLALSTEKELKHSYRFFASTTDFDVHQLWMSPLVEQYYVFCEESAWQLSAKGIPKEKISVTGIPLTPEFTKKQSKQRARTILSLPLKNFTLLVMSGGFGVGHVRETLATIRELLELYPTKNFTLIIICGKNQELLASISSELFPKNITLVSQGFVNNVHEYMDAADVLISKPGGLTSSEALAKHLPMIIVNPIPGQETRNADILVEHGAAWKAHNTANIGYKLKRIIENPEYLRLAQIAAKHICKPRAAETILKDVLRRISYTSEK